MTHLVKASCSGCREAEVYCVPELQQFARCSGCGWAVVGERGVVTGGPGPVVPRWTVDEALAASALSFVRAGDVEQLSVFPAPEVTPDNPWPDDVAVPRGVRDLEKYAVGLGWAVKLQYSRGYGMHSTRGTPLTLSHWIGVRMQCRAAACGAVGYAVYQAPVAGAGRQVGKWSMHNARHTRGALPGVAAVRGWLGGHGHEIG